MTYKRITAETDFSCASSSVHRGVFIGKGKALFASWKGDRTLKIALLLFFGISFINLLNVFQSTFCGGFFISFLGGTVDASLFSTVSTVVVAKYASSWIK
jgi:hypothetical protein